MATDDPEAGFVAFVAGRRVATGPLTDVAVAIRRVQEQDPEATALIFDRRTAQVVDLDLRGRERDIVARLAPPGGQPAKRGRPKLGVVAREVTLLPRHWEWLGRQPGGASVTLRRLVEAAGKADAGAENARARTEAAYRFMAAAAGDLPGFEEAARALFAGDRARMETCMAPWPPDIREEALRFVDNRVKSASTNRLDVGPAEVDTSGYD